MPREQPKEQTGPTHDRGARRSGFKPWYLLPVALLGVLGIVAAAGRTSSQGGPSRVDPSSYDGSGSGEGGSSFQDMLSAQTSAVLVSVYAITEKNNAADTAAHEIDEALTARDCPRALVGMPALRDAAKQPPSHASPSFLSALDDLERALAKACAQSPPGADHPG